MSGLPGCPYPQHPRVGVVVMARPHLRIRIRGPQRDPLDIPLLAQVVLMLAAERSDTPDIESAGESSADQTTQGHPNTARRGDSDCGRRRRS